MKIKNFTAYCIGGDLYLRRGKPNEKKRKEIIKFIQENKKNKEGRAFNETSNCHGPFNGWQKAQTAQAKLPFND